MLQRRALFAQPALGKNFSSLDGLRGLLLIWVMYIHAPIEAGPAFLREVRQHWIFGVDGFLALSGFLVMRSLILSARLHAPRDGTAARFRPVAAEFLMRRFARILPPYYLMLAVIVGLSYFSHGFLHATMKHQLPRLPYFPTFLANYAIPNKTHDYVPLALGIYWSISFQEQFYLLLLALFFLQMRLRPQERSGELLKRGLLVLGIGSAIYRIALAAWIWGESNRWVYLELWTHLSLDSMTWGCLAWLYYDELRVLWSTRRRAIGIAVACLLLLLGSTAARSFTNSDLGYAVMAAIKAPALALLVRLLCAANEHAQGFAGLVDRLLCARWLRKLGQASYEIYLVHGICYNILSNEHGIERSHMIVFGWPLIIPLGFAFHYGFGRPAQKVMRKLLDNVFGRAAPKPPRPEIRPAPRAASLA